MVKNIIFDLDGTLIDSLTDIRAALNESLKACSLPLSYSKSEVRGFIGDGADALLHKALGDLDSPSAFDCLKKEYLPRYLAFQNHHTRPFNGLPSVLEYLKNRSISLFVCTNKPQEHASQIVAKAFREGLFEEVRGLQDGEPPKPDRTLPDSLISKHSLNREETYFVGDSLVDLLTAHNASLPLALCLWGYGFYKPSLLAEAKIVLNKPKEVAKLALL